MHYHDNGAVVGYREFMNWSLSIVDEITITGDVVCRCDRELTSYHCVELISGNIGKNLAAFGCNVGALDEDVDTTRVGVKSGDKMRFQC